GEGSVAPGRPCVGDGRLGAAGSCHLGRVEVGQAEVEPERQCGDLILPGLAVLAHVPGALAYDGDLDAGDSERTADHPASVHRASMGWASLAVPRRGRPLASRARGQPWRDRSAPLRLRTRTAQTST